MRILITGSRDWPDDGSVQDVLFDYILEELESGRLPDHRLVTFVHGAASGADTEVKRTVEFWQKLGRSNVELEPYPADWKKYGKSAGFKRNQEMVDLGADVLLAFLGPCRKHPDANHPSHGALDTVDRCFKAGIPVVAYEYDY